MANTAAAKKTAASASDTTEKKSPLKREVRTIISLSVEGDEYSGEVAADNPELDVLDEIASEWDEVSAKYEEVTARLKAKLGELGIEPPAPEPEVKKRAAVSDAPKIRRWATRTGVELPARGAIPVNVREKYELAKFRDELKDDEK